MRKIINIGVDITFTPSGGSYTQVVNMLEYLSREEGVKLVIFSKKNNRSVINNLDKSKYELLESKFSNMYALTRVIWEQLFLPFYLYKYKVDVIFCPGDISPIFTSVKKVQWIGTIGPFWGEIYDYDIGVAKRIKYPLNKYLMYKSAEYADHVIFESDYTKNYFLNHYKIKKENVSVINIGKDEYLLEEVNVRSGNHGYKDFVLCVSHLYPYKNILRMIESFYHANKKTGHSIKLLIAGAFVIDKYTASIRKIIDDLNYRDNIILLGMVDKKRLRSLYENCEFLLFPSPCENFAYTLVEAMSLGAPVVCSNTTAMPDTCLDAAIYFNPYDLDDMTNKITKMLDNKKLQNEYSIKSLERANSLPSYQQVTRKTINICRSVIGLNE